MATGAAADALIFAVEDLIGFVGALEMGGYYAERIRLELRFEEGFKIERCRQHLLDAREAISALIVEQLRFQKWEPVQRRF